jgi:hypothetical protein
MGILKRLLRAFLILCFILLISSPFWIKSVSLHVPQFLIGKLKLADKYLCTYTAQISGQSMSPLLATGSSLSLDRCFNENDLREGTVVLFEDGSSARVGIIRHILSLENRIYKISDEKAPTLYHDKVLEEIVAISNDIETSQSVYVSEGDEDKFILSADEYLSELYLAKIPKGSGLENSEIEKTQTFNLKEDKFCYGIKPKVDMYGVSIEILNIETGSTIIKGENIVFNPSSSVNINCQEFGDDMGMFDIKAGKYQFRLLLNHQIIERIDFEIS